MSRVAWFVLGLGFGLIGATGSSLLQSAVAQEATAPVAEQPVCPPCPPCSPVSDDARAKAVEALEAIEKMEQKMAE